MRRGSPRKLVLHADAPKRRRPPTSTVVEWNLSATKEEPMSSITVIPLSDERVCLKSDPAREPGIVERVNNDGSVTVWWTWARRRWVYDAKQLRRVRHEVSS